MNFSERLQFAMNNKVIDGVKGVKIIYRHTKIPPLSQARVLQQT